MSEIQYLEINDVTRIIKVPTNLLLGVMEDKDVERVYFKCKKIVGDNVDLSKHQLYVKYVNALDNSGKNFDVKTPGIYHCEDVVDHGDYITFSWLLSGNVFKKGGFVAFSVLASDGETTRWNTFPAIGTVLITIPGGLQEVEERYPDIITQLLNRMDDVEAMATPEAMQGYVNTYLAAHPAEIDPELLNPKKCAPADVVGQLKEDLGNTKYQLSESIAETSDDVKDLYINKKIESMSNGYKFFEFHVKAGAKFTITNNTSAGTNIHTFSAPNGELIETVASALQPNSSAEFTATKEARYIRILFQASGNMSFVGTNTIVSNIEKKIHDVNVTANVGKKVEEDVGKYVFSKNESKNLLSSNVFTDEYIAPNGSIKPATTDVLTDYFEVGEGRLISLTRITGGNFGSYTRGKECMSSIAFYDRNKELISWLSRENYKLPNTDVETPLKTRYARAAFEKAYSSTYQVMIEYVDNGSISEDYADYFNPYIVYNNMISKFSVPYPLKPSFVKKSGQYNGCLSDIKTVDGKDILYGFSGGGIVRSSNGDDKGSPNINISRPTSNGTVNFIKKLDDKTLLVGYEGVDGYSRIYKGTSETWNASELKFDSTWSEVLVAETRGQRWSMWFGLSIHKNIIFVAEYGEHNAARNAYLSTDYGKTFTKVFTAEIDISGAGVHIHDVCYDPYSGMLWLCTGDGYWAQNVYFSYDMGTTWNKNYEYRESPSQFTSILPLPNCVLFVSDNSKHMAVYRCDRITLQNKPAHIELNEAYVNYNDYNAESPIGTNGCIAYGKDACAYFGWTERLDVVKTKSPVIGTKDGYNFYEVWNCGENFDQVSGSKTFVGIYGVYGVTENGNIGISFVKQEYGTTGMHSIIMPVQEWC